MRHLFTTRPQVALLAACSAIIGIAVPARSVTFQPPGDLAPDETEGAASRESQQCASQGDRALTLIVPDSNNGYTVQPRPTFLAYVPPTAANGAFFSIQDESGNQLYETVVSLPEEPGITAIRLSDRAPALEPGRTYRWFVVPLCAPLDPSAPTAGASVRRLPYRGQLPDAREPLTLEEIERLAASGLWYDAAFALSELARSRPNDPQMQAEWEEMLNSAGLEDIIRGRAASSPDRQQVSQ